MLNAPSLKKTLLFLFISVFLISFVFLFYLIIPSSPCRNWYGKPLITGLTLGNYESTNEYFRMLDTKACVISVTDKVDTVFPNSSERLKIGYFDSFWKLHVYPARIGGSTYKGDELNVGLCFQRKDSTVCTSSSPSRVLSNFPKDEISLVQIVVQDSATELWEGAKQTTKYQHIFDQLRKALKTNKNYPENIPEDFVIQINQITNLSSDD